MARYVDAFVLPVPKKNLGAYRKMAQHGGKLWKKYGALEYVECIIDDVKPEHSILTFPKGIRARKGEAVWFSWILYKSKKDRKRVTAKVMNDPSMKMGKGTKMPFDLKRMLYGGFKPIVDL